MADIDTQTQLLSVDEAQDVVSLRKCQLIVMEGPSKGKKLDLGKNKISLGKKDDNDLVVDDRTVSRRHLEIDHTSDSFLLKDLGSTNGTYINGIKVKEAYLSPGDVIKVGNTRIEFVAFDERIKVEPADRESFGQMVGKSRKIRQIFGILEKISPTEATVIIEGETGTGKELVARAIHDNSPRKSRPFIVFDCSAVAENLIESELFGHVKGSFTGAIATRKGAFESATGGTIFLDEIGELTLDLQPKLLRALEQREIRKVGSVETIPIDVRVITATNRGLKKEVVEGRFREDLYYRLSVVKIHLPSLRERPDDIPPLVERFLSTGKFNQGPDGKLRVTRVEDDALKMLQRYNWPGNVRELFNILERATSMSDSNTLAQAQLSYIFAELDREEEMTERSGTTRSDIPFKEAKSKLVESFEKDYLLSLMRRNNYNISKAAREAGIDRKHIRNLLKKYGIDGKDDEL